MVVNKENPNQFLLPPQKPIQIQKNNLNKPNNFLNNNAPNNNKFFLDDLGVSPTYENPRPYTAQPKMSQPINLMPASSKNSKPQTPNYNFDPFHNMKSMNNNAPTPQNIQPNAYPQEKLRNYANMNNNNLQGNQNQQANNNYNNNQNNQDYNPEYKRKTFLLFFIGIIHPINK